MSAIDFLHPPEEGLVTCIVPVHDGERFVAEAIDSILRQSWARREVVVVDDGSTDGTPGVLRGFGERIRVLRQENEGPAAARNHGMRESRGEFLAFLDADDIWVDDKLERQMAVLAADAELGICSAHIRSFWIPELDHERAALEDHPYHRERPMLSPCTVVIRRAVVERIGGFAPELRHGEDTDFFLRAMKGGVRHHTIPSLLVHRRHHFQNLTRQERPSHDRLLGLLKRNLDRNRAP